MDNRIYYKALALDRGSIYAHGDWRVIYPRQKWVKSKIRGTPLLVFDALFRATTFIGGNGGIIVPCWIKKDKRQDYPLGPIHQLHYVSTEEGTSEGWDAFISRADLIPPQGTVFARSVFCLE